MSPPANKSKLDPHAYHGYHSIDSQALAVIGIRNDGYHGYHNWFGLQMDSTEGSSRRVNSVTVRGIWSGRRDLNSGPLAPQASALARLRHGPKLLFYVKPRPAVQAASRSNP